MGQCQAWVAPDAAQSLIHFYRNHVSHPLHSRTPLLHSFIESLLSIYSGSGTVARLLLFNNNIKRQNESAVK